MLLGLLNDAMHIVLTTVHLSHTG